MADPSRAVAEEAREKVWGGESFLRDVFFGRFRIDLLESLDLDDVFSRDFWNFYDALEAFCRDAIDPVEIDHSGEYPRQVIDGLAELGAFGMKIPKRLLDGEYLAFERGAVALEITEAELRPERVDEPARKAS